MTKKNIRLTSSAFVAGVALVALVATASAQAVVPGWDADPTAVKSAMQGDAGYLPPDPFRYPYISTYYVKPTVMSDEAVKVGVYVTDFEHSKIRFLDDSHRFTAFLEYRTKGGASKVLALEGLRSGDAEFNLGKLPVGDFLVLRWP